MVRTAGGSLGWGVGGLGAVDWIPGILRRRRGVRGKQPPTSLHLVMPWHLSALRSKLSQSRHGSCENGQHQSRTFRARILLEAGSAGVLRSITAVSVQSLRLRLCGPWGDRDEKKNSTCMGTAAITSFCWLLFAFGPPCRWAVRCQAGKSTFNTGDLGWAAERGGSRSLHSVYPHGGLRYGMSTTTS